MEIKDIVVTVDGETVRGGSDIVQAGANIGLNKAFGLSHNVGAGNKAETTVGQKADQSLMQDAKLSDVYYVEQDFSVTGSVLDLGSLLR